MRIRFWEGDVGRAVQFLRISSARIARTTLAPIRDRFETFVEAQRFGDDAASREAGAGIQASRSAVPSDVERRWPRPPSGDAWRS
jgi:hypothetical protein